ncbi:MAG: NAD-dependent epimerase/dehydratase family protein [Candidatus Lokiarchaeota archaeon]|nr:NAD-dependent epimerase/dehydratase family protein [Candidatus Lokiarchaeota archaeon]
MTKCFVTGGTGFIGNHIVRTLVQKGHEVTILVRESSDLYLLEDVQVRTVIGDITEVDSLSSAIPEDTEWLFHNAAIMSDWGGKQHFWPVNVEGTRNILDFVVEKEIPNLIYTSSTALYGFPNTEEPMHENYPHKPANAYQKSKLAAEELVWEYSEKHGFNATAIRPPIVLGYGDMYTGPNIIKLMRSGEYTIFSGGNNKQSIVHGEDVGRALVLAAEKMDVANGNAYNVVSFTTEMKEFAEMVADELDVEKDFRNIPYKVAVGLGAIVGGLYRAFLRPNPPLITSFRVKMLGSNYIVDSSKIKDELGFEPKWNREETVKDLVQWGGEIKPR